MCHHHRHRLFLLLLAFFERRRTIGGGVFSFPFTSPFPFPFPFPSKDTIADWGSFLVGILCVSFFLIAVLSSKFCVWMSCEPMIVVCWLDVGGAYVVCKMSSWS